jgi:hypothetical protein
MKIPSDADAAKLLQLMERYKNNINRVINLLDLYKKQAGHGGGRRASKADDILRAAIVLLHAALEDFLRTFEHILAPYDKSELLSEIPLAGSKDRSSKFTLAALRTHSGKSVDDVIRDSVAEHLGKRSYSNTDEIAACLQRMGLDPAKVRKYFPRLESMISRRHNIVHRADANTQTGPRIHPTRSISKATVFAWTKNVNGFLSVLIELAKQRALKEKPHAP